MTTPDLTGARAALLNHAVPVLGGSPSAGATLDLTPYLALLPRGNGPVDALTAILTTLAPPGAGAAPATYEPAPLALDRGTIMPGQPPGVSGPSFAEEWSHLSDPTGVQFETACDLIRKHGWAVPGTLGEEGVSLWEEFKLLSALVHASGGAAQPVESVTLAAGDFPGIQGAIYTITSKGAARGLRGRSLFLQLLADGITRRLLLEFDLPPTNVLYLAGGNFVLILPPGADEVIHEVITPLTRRLLAFYRGDISLVTASLEVPTSALATGEFEAHYRALKAQLGHAKLQPFAAVAIESWDAVFEPTGGASSDHCAVCYHDPGPGEQLHRYRDDLWCSECMGFDQLARQLATHSGYLFVSTAYRDPEDPGDWRESLSALTGLYYDLHSTPPANADWVYTLNDTAFLDDGVTGFRFLATRTPHNDDGTIRDFRKLAKAAKGLDRIGILRMDVDNLGRVFGEYITPFTPTRLSAASAAMSVFFDGWLNAICAGLEADFSAPESLYIIYAGGDDLFVVGPWDLMPELAQRIHDELAAYVNGSPHITISAGISVEFADFPLYRAAERARAALDDEAKGRDGKNAISFLQEVVGWDDGEWDHVVSERNRLTSLVTERGLPTALIQAVRRVHAQYLEDRNQRGSTDGIVYGRWMWQQAYSLTRMAERNKDAAGDIAALQESLLSPDRIHLAGLAARWVDYLKRTKTNEE